MAETQRVAILTGAAGGIGRAMVRGLLAAGIRVAGVDRDREPSDALAASAREQGKGSELFTIQSDLASDSVANEIATATRTRFGRIDILINNAGIGPGSIRPDTYGPSKAALEALSAIMAKDRAPPRRLAGAALSIYARRADREYPRRLRMAA
jgi:short-subunit dehydrogenase involved in D-alanine esterification of teichoic acids